MLAMFFQNEIIWIASIASSSIFLVLSIFSKERVFSCALFLFLSTLPLYLVFPMYQPLLMLVIITLLISALFYKKEIFVLFKKGEINSIRIWLAIIIVSLIASISLVLWGLWTDNLGVGAPIIAELKKHSSFLILAIVPISALLNAIVEETIFRGIIQTELSNVFTNSTAILLQALLFAGFHYAGGFPNGAIGFGMTFIYACALGIMRYKVKGLLAPIIAHATADLTILVFLWVCF